MNDLGAGVQFTLNRILTTAVQLHHSLNGREEME